MSCPPARSRLEPWLACDAGYVFTPDADSKADWNRVLDAIVAEELYKPWYMHRTSHWLGVDVHDSGDYCRGGMPRPLAPNYVLTIAPALYIAAGDDTAAPELRGTGVRIEDDVLVTAKGPEVLSAACPKSVSELESLIGSATN